MFVIKYFLFFCCLLFVYRPIFISDFPNQTPSSSATMTPTSSPSASMLVSALDFKDYGCNSVPISMSNVISEDYTYENNNYTKILNTALYSVKTGSVICNKLDNRTEISGVKNPKSKTEMLNILTIKDLISYYITENIREIAVNIKPDIYCVCHCDIFEQYDYTNCDTQNCVQVHSPTKNGCLLDNGWGSCTYSFNEYEIATLFKLSKPIYSYLNYEHVTVLDLKEQHLTQCKNNANDMGDYDHIFGFQPGTYVLNRTNKNIFTLPQNSIQSLRNCKIHSVNNPENDDAYNDNTNGYCACNANIIIPMGEDLNVSVVGTFNDNGYEGGDHLLRYKDEIYVVQNANALNEYDPTKFGWLTLDNQNNTKFDVNKLSNSLSLSIHNCGKGNIKLTGDINVNDVFKLVPFKEYVAKFGVINFVYLDSGVIELSYPTEDNALLEISGKYPFKNIKYTYGIKSFQCYSSPSYSSSRVNCTISYNVGDRETTYYIYNENNEVVYQNNILLDGTGKQQFDLTIPHQAQKTNNFICFESNNNIPKCMNITLEADQTNITNPNWVVKVNDTDESSSYSFDIPNFNFFNPSTWEDHIAKTVISFLGIFFAFIICIILFIIFIWCLPEITVGFSNILLGIRKYRKLRSAKKSHNGEDSVPSSPIFQETIHDDMF